MIRVGFDISQTAHPGGVANYTQNLAALLSKLPDLEMAFFYSSLRKPYTGGLKNVKRFHFPPTFFEKVFNNLRIFNIERFIGSMDVFHSSDWMQPPTKAKKVTTYHDAIPLMYPKWSDPKVVSVHKRRLKIVEREIDMVIAVSESTKRDLLKISNIPEDKIVVIYEGPSVEYRDISEKEKLDFRNKYNLPDDYVLAMGGVGERKNLARIKQAAFEYNLVIPGETTAWVPSAELSLLYACAKVLLYPSLYEGFGLPVLDAMECHLPVITSNRSSLPEVGGDAVLYVDPENVDDIKKNLDKLVNDADLQKELIKKGVKQAGKFSWEKAAKETAQVYKAVVNK